MAEKDFHKYCLIYKIWMYDAAGSEVPEHTASTWRLTLTGVGLDPRIFLDNSFWEQET